MDHSVTSMLKKARINYRGLSYAFIILVLILLFIFYFIQIRAKAPNETIKVGVLFSQSGYMADTERPVLRATLLAIEEINHKGGIKGHLIEPIVYDPGSDLKQTAHLATKMVVEDKVVVIFGCFTSASRKVVKDVVEKFDNLLLYPVSYEGIEESKNIIYLGLAPNQQLVPAVSWIFEQKGNKVYLVGSDYIWPRVANEIIAQEIKVMSGEIVGTQYLKMGDTDVRALVEDIIAKKPDFVYSTIVGPSNIAFLNEFYAKIPISQMPSMISFGIMPYEINKEKRSKFIKLHTVWAYHRGLNNPENKAFLKAYKKKYGSNMEIDDPAITSYSGVYLWAQAVREAPTMDPIKVRSYILRRSIASPGGVMYVDPVNANTWRKVYIERINQNGISEVVWSSSVPIEPIIYPEYQTKAEWNLFEHQLYMGWGESWEKN
jgi:urea transport system substrate-binding protein